MEKYEQPGVKINSKPPSKEYKDNYDQVFGKKESWLDKRLRKEKDKLYIQEVVVENDKIKHDNCTD